jgi:heme-degrading monooxygenase HmoA
MTGTNEVVCIFTSTRRLDNDDQYVNWATKMETLVRVAPGYVRHVSVRDCESRRGVTVSYFDSEASLLQWRNDEEHLRAQDLGREQFYDDYRVEIATVTRAYRWSRYELNDQRSR